MKKNFYLLLCAVCVALCGCNNNEPTTPGTEPTELTEGDFVVKFYACDSLLKYCTYTITCITDSTLDCSGFKAAHPDLSTSDSADWQAIYDLAFLLDDCDLTVNNTQLIAKTVHLKKGTHKFQIHFARNQVPLVMPKMDILMGGSYYCTTSGLAVGRSTSPIVLGGVETDKFDDFLSINSDYKITIKF